MPDGYIHRAAWILANGLIPDRLTIDHLCKVKTCCNPAHMELVAQGENTRRAHQGVCRKGHEMTPDNITRNGGTLLCKRCRREYRRQRKAASRG